MRLRSHLVLLALAVLAPVLVFGAVTTLIVARAEREALTRGLTTRARLLALAVDRELTGTVAALTALAASEGLAAGNLPAVYREAQRLLATQPGWGTIVVVDRTGAMILNLLRPLGAPLPSSADRPVIRTVLEEDRPAVSNLVEGRVSGEHNIIVAVPVRVRGEVRYALTCSVRPDALAAILLREPLAPHDVVTLVDGEHRIVARSRRSAEFVGRPISLDLAVQLASSAEGIVRGTDAEGLDSYGAYGRVTTAGWSVVVSVPAAALEAPLGRSMATLGLAALVSLLVAAGLALVFGRRIAAPMKALAAAAQRVGRREIPGPMPTAVSEIAAVGRAIDEAGALLRAQDAQRERVEAALRRSSETFQALVSASPLGIMIVDAQGIVRLWNPACERIFGWLADDVVGRFLPAVDEHQRTEFLAGIQATLAGRGLRTAEARRRRRDGWFWASVSSAALPDEQGHPAYCLAIVEDVTARRQAERRRAAEHAVHTILAEEPFVADAGRRVLAAVGRELEWDFGALWRPAGQPPGLECEDVWAASDDLRLFVAVSRACRFPPGRGIPGRVWVTAEPAWVADIAADPNFPRRRLAARAGLRSAMAFPVIVGRRAVAVLEFCSREPRPRDDEMVTVLRSIGTHLGQFTERHTAMAQLARLLEAEQEARAEAERATHELTRLQLITDATLAKLTVDELVGELLRRVRQVVGVDTAAIFLVEGDQVVLRAADGLEAGQTRAPIPLGRGFVGRVAATASAPVVAPDIDEAGLHDPFLEHRGIRSLLGAPLVVQGRVTGVMRVGSAQARGFSEADARLLQLVADRAAVALEAARLHEAEREARTQAEAASRAKDEFLAMLAHELRNPLASIRAATHVIGRLDAGPAVQPARDIIVRQVAHLVRLLDDLLDVARITQGKIELLRRPVPVRTAVAEAVEATRALMDQKGHVLAVELAEELVVDADPTRLVQIVANLLNNAAKYTPPGGSIGLRADADGDRAVIAVTDNGIGIAPDVLPRIFDLFAQGDPSVARSEGGLGVGLTLVKTLVDLHGGSVTAHSEGRGRGSEFVIRLPLAAAVPAEELPPRQPTSRRRVLVIEDNADAAAMLEAALRLEGHQVSVAADGPTGVARAVAERPEVLLVDIGLPGLDGYEVARRVRAELGQGVRLVALSGYGQPHDRDRGAAAGFDAYLVKPIDPAILAGVVGASARGATVDEASAGPGHQAASG